MTLDPRSSIDPASLADQRARGWPDFHPEEYCHRCGRPNIKAWFAPEWGVLHGSHAGILCPVCFADYDPSAVWMLTRWSPPDEAQVSDLAAFLRVVSGMPEDADRVARCIIDAGWNR